MYCLFNFDVDIGDYFYRFTQSRCTIVGISSTGVSYQIRENKIIRSINIFLECVPTLYSCHGIPKQPKLKLLC